MKNIQKRINISLVILILLIDFAALFDILNKEPDLTGEWDFIFYSFLFFGIIIIANYSSFKKWITKK